MRSLTIQEKLEIIDAVENGKSVKEVSEETGINRNSLHYILKNRNKIREEVGKNPTLSKHKRLKQTKNPHLEAEILKFIYEAREKGEKLTGSIIKAVALETSIKMGIDNFGASNGWLFSFFKRNGININDFNKTILANQDVVMNEIVETEESSYYVTSDVQYEVEYTQQEMVNDTSEYSEINEYHCDWRVWCKFCGFNGQTEVLQGANDDICQFLKTLFKFNQLDSDIRCCQKCQNSFEQSSKFLIKAKHMENMFIEIDEHDRLNSLTEENVRVIRQHYINDDFSEHTFDDEASNEQIEQQNMIYEEDYLEEAAEFKHVEEYELIQENVEDNTEQISEIPSPNTNNLQNEEQQFVYDCHVCGENFERMCFLSNHTRLSHNCLPQVACNCGKYLATWDSLMAHKRKHSNDPADWICDICNAKFQTKTGLSIHIKFKHDQKKQVQFICNICKKDFNDATVLKSHARTHSSIEEKLQYECNFCLKRLSSKYSLKIHIQTIHEKQMTIFCHLCTKGFTNKSNLRSHLISHTTEYVTCDICNQIFKNRISLQSHKKIHKPKESLNFACNHCDKKFHNRNHLDRHLISHSNHKNYKCDKCSAAYKWEKDLKNHDSSMHNGEEMKNQCEYCSRFFNDVANLRKHKLRHHQDEMTEYELKYGKRSSV